MGVRGAGGELVNGFGLDGVVGLVGSFEGWGGGIFLDGGDNCGDVEGRVLRIRARNSLLGRCGQ